MRKILKIIAGICVGLVMLPIAFYAFVAKPFVERDIIGIAILVAVVVFIIVALCTKSKNKGEK